VFPHGFGFSLWDSRLRGVRVKGQVSRVRGVESEMMHHLSSKSGDFVKHGEVFVGRVALSE